MRDHTAPTVISQPPSSKSKVKSKCLFVDVNSSKTTTKQNQKKNNNNNNDDNNNSSRHNARIGGDKTASNGPAHRHHRRSRVSKAKSTIMPTFRREFSHADGHAHSSFHSDYSYPQNICPSTRPSKTNQSYLHQPTTSV